MKKQITLRIDDDLLNWFKSKGKGYHGIMHKALEKYRMFNTPNTDVQEYYRDEPIEMKPIILPKKDEIIPKLKEKIEKIQGDPFFRPMPKRGK